MLPVGKPGAHLLTLRVQRKKPSRPADLIGPIRVDFGDADAKVPIEVTDEMRKNLDRWIRAIWKGAIAFI